MSTLSNSSLSPNRGPEIIKILTPLSTIVTIFVGLRIGVRIRCGVAIGVDDWLILCSLLLSWGLYVLGVTFVQYGGLGRPLAVNLAINPQRFLISQNILFSSEFLYPSVIATTKLSILAMYYRIFPTRYIKYGKLVVGSITTMWWTAYILVTIFQCMPIAKVLDKSIQGYCLPLYAFFLGSSIPNIVTDIVILSLPLYEIRKLHLPLRNRAALAGIFLLGAGVTAISGVRLWYHIELLEKGTNSDLTLDFYNPVLWTILEPDLAIICACLPITGPPLFRALIDSYLLRQFSNFISKSQKGEENSDTRGRFVSISGERMQRNNPRNSQHYMAGWSSHYSGHFRHTEDDIELCGQAEDYNGPRAAVGLSN
ncbi:hypothetical protein F4824DRAFT_505450 [Ustulina deusta]|nr:hypothetical protein F4824DRAFT_505450 [Ustulina deusta]